MFASLWNKGDKINTNINDDDVTIKNTNLRNNKTIIVPKYIDAENQFVKKIIINNVTKKETIEYYLNFVIEKKNITINHEKNTYYGNYKDNEIGFHFYIDNGTSSICPIVGRFEQIPYEYESFELSPSLKYVKGNITCVLIEDSSSKHLSFTESSKNITISVKNNLLAIDSLRFKVYLFKNPLFDNYIKNASTKDMLNCLINYNNVCDFNYDFGVGFKQIVKSRNDYRELFKNHYEINKIIFSENLPSATSLFKTFEGCYNLEEVDITPIQGDCRIFTRCFAHCKKLIKLKINKNKNPCRIGGMFLNCKSLAKLAFPFIELTNSKEWKNGTNSLNTIETPLIEKFMKF